MGAFNTAFTVGRVAVTWSGVVLAASVLLAIVVSAHLSKRRGLYRDLVLDLSIICIPSGLLGARLFAVLSGKISFSAFFDLGTHGMNLPGMLLFAVTGVAIYTKLKKLSFTDVFDALAPGALFALALGRWSDFFLCEGLGPVVSQNVPKFFPLATFTPQYFTDGKTVAYAVFFLDFLVCAALGVTALLLHARKSGSAFRVTAILYLFCEFVLEWLRDSASRCIVFGQVRFNHIVLLLMLFAAIALSLHGAKREMTEPSKPNEPEKTEEESK